MDLVQVILDPLLVGDTIEATQLEDELEEAGNPMGASNQTATAKDPRKARDLTLARRSIVS